MDGQWWLAHSDERPKEAEIVARWIKQQSWHTGKVGLIGFSAGGAVALNYANIKNDYGDNISAVVAFYPACDHFVIGPKSDLATSSWTVKIPTQIQNGSADDWTPSYLCNINNAEIITYPNATHAFDRDEGVGGVRTYLGHKMRYDKEIHNQSKVKVKEFFDKHIN